MRQLVFIAALAIGMPAAQGGADDPSPVHVAPLAQVEVDPDAPTVGASLDHSEAHVGDRLALTITATAHAGITVNLPQKLELGKLELLERDDTEAAGRDIGDARRSFRFLLYVAAYEVGPTEVPPIELSYLGPRGDVRHVTTAPVSLDVRALVDESAANPEPQPPRLPRSSMIEDRRVTLIAAAVGGAIMLGLVALLISRALKKRRRKVTLEMGGPVVPARPPGEVAIERLTAIRARGDFARDGYRPFAFETAEVLRAYLGARYGFDSLELTSTELFDELRHAAPHLAAYDGEVGRFVERTDLIKFAKTGANETEALSLLDAAQAIVLATAPKLEMAAEMLSGPMRPAAPSAGARGHGEGEA